MQIEMDRLEEPSLNEHDQHGGKGGKGKSNSGQFKKGNFKGKGTTTRPKGFKKRRSDTARSTSPSGNRPSKKANTPGPRRLS